MKKKAKITLSILASLGFLLALPVSSSVALFSNSHIYEDTFLGGMKLKRDRLKSIQGKKIVLIGGSSLPFGIKSELIEKELPSYSVVDFGLYAALGSEAMLDLALPYLKEGDIAIISIEQNEQALSSYFSPRTMWQAIDNCKDALFDLDEKDRKLMLGDALSFSSEKMPYLTSSTKAEGEGVYVYSSFNEYGDVESEATASNIMFEGVDSNQMISFSSSIVPVTSPGTNVFVTLDEFAIRSAIVPPITIPRTRTSASTVSNVFLPCSLPNACLTFISLAPLLILLHTPPGCRKAPGRVRRC